LGLVRDRHTAVLSQRVDYAGLVEPEDRPDAPLEAELASFAALIAGTGNGDVHPDQLDLLTLINDHDDHDSQEQQ